ncbi:hypothetical protein PsorP6_000628 [Peronosclerospora sorghi]|uniref:Uncharacterized protein n=1 Tax=Peronosclerospora sorghi TaxID=230839 RepID=A0ACC0WV19_9STRA|nr:hypothetical protein PsorP6_000628 [Peronosclerospora sorghi]
MYAPSTGTLSPLLAIGRFTSFFVLLLPLLLTLSSVPDFFSTVLSLIQTQTLKEMLPLEGWILTPLFSVKTHFYHTPTLVLGDRLETASHFQKNETTVPSAGVDICVDTEGGAAARATEWIRAVDSVDEVPGVAETKTSVSPYDEIMVHTT